MVEAWAIVGGERAAEFRAVLGTAGAHPAPWPILARLPGRPPPDRVYLLDVARLSVAQRTALARHLAAKFDSPMGEVQADLGRGLPILAEDVTVDVQNPGRWFA